jgi:hypothetical protein
MAPKDGVYERAEIYVRSQVLFDEKFLFKFVHFHN